MGEGFDRACSHWTRASESNLSWPGQNHELCLKGARMDAGLEKTEHWRRRWVRWILRVGGTFWGHLFQMFVSKEMMQSSGLWIRMLAARRDVLDENARHVRVQYVAPCF